MKIGKYVVNQAKFISRVNKQTGVKTHRSMRITHIIYERITITIRANSIPKHHNII